MLIIYFNIMENKKSNNSKKSYESESESLSTLSDELNNISENNNSNDNNYFNITNIYNNIASTLSNYNNNVKIIGEIITFKITDTNAWINVKSDDFQILCVFWKITIDNNYKFYKSIKSGDKIIFNGKFKIMKKNLNIYFNVNLMEKNGKGEYLDIYNNYRLKIKELNLPKKQLNIFPYIIGIITSLEGAAIQDILQTFKIDKFIGKIIIKNSIVQGFHCPKSLINSIEWFENTYSQKQIDLLMITRGGGGYEDLIGFSDWNLLIKLSEIKFITLSAVGHHIDNQLTDEVCDYKFATPSIGAKFIIEMQQKYINYLKMYKNSIDNIIKIYNNHKIKFDYISNNYSNILKKYDIKEMLIKTKKYTNQINNLLLKYNNSKNLFFAMLSNLKPSIFREKELTSINDFININDEIISEKKSKKSKKIEIYFIDGRISISYKIIEYEKFE